MIRALVFSVLREYGLSPDPDGTDADLDDVAQNYFDRGGTFRVLVSPAEEVVGCGGLYPLDAEEVEIRKMYFLPEVRGLGLGRALLNELIVTAQERGFRRIVLETASVLKEAISLYARFGFRAVQRDHMARRCDQAYVLDLNRGA
jgi:GNAT superfamily N-acetyltransferase